MIRSLRLQQCFDAAAMQAELAVLDAALWRDHYNTGMYQGGWTVLPLRSLNGSAGNIISIHQGANKEQVYKNTPLMQYCPYTGSVVDYFKCDKTAVRFMKLDAGAVIKEHRDHAMRFEDGEARLHIPVITNKDVEFLLENERVIMQEGECWYLDLSLKHAVRNPSTTHRVHLVIDLVVNDWLRQLFETEGREVQYAVENKSYSYNRETQMQVIAQLREMNTATSLALADKMEKEIS